MALGELDLVTELPGRLEASRVAQVRARAAGILQQRLFQEGSQVRAGQALFKIDSAPYAAALQGAQASLAKAQAALGTANALVTRNKALTERNFISEQRYTDALAAEQAAKADVAVAKAGVQSASLAVGYATVTAPIDGRIGRSLVSEGALVGQGEATQLAVIQQVDPMYVNFTQSASEALRLKRSLDNGELMQAGTDQANVRVVFEDGSEYDQVGKLLFTDPTVDPSTGQVSLRAELPNPRGLLLPGLYVRVRLEQARVSNAVALPQQAVTRSGQGDSVMVVDAEGHAAPRSVVVAGQQGGQWVVVDGLQAADQVMVDGFQKLRGGAPVKPVPWTPPGSQSASSQAGLSKSASK